MHYGQVGVLVNNAGMLENCWNGECWDAIMAVNYTGAISLAEQMLPVLADGAPAC
jgi:NAD(P)-dependent dehydrogenase (short-subunit alcohol dehydrogenase family)